MCGRFTQMATWKELVEYFNLVGAKPAEVTPRYNVAPSQQVAVVREDAEGKRHLAFLRWGFIPSWSKDGKIAPINAMSETVGEKPMFRSAFKKRRCLLAATGFYEWKKVGSKKQPVHFRLRSRHPFGFAGIWETWHTSEGEEVETCALLTTEPNELVKPVHNRMPVILAPKDYEQWLDPAMLDTAALQTMLDPHAAELMEAVPASDYVNNARHEGPECLAAPAVADSRASLGKPF
jgi:putative SOS response-associated peptidase YedK